MSDHGWMQRALVLARKGLGTTAPNPMVGAIVLSASGKVVGHGYHRKAGSDHAEVIALRMAGEKARGGTLYVTLEPCSHHGKTPPCVEAIMHSGVRRVVVSVLDPNPKVNGQGVARLRERGIDVVLGIEEHRAQRLNRVFLKHIQQKKIFVCAKVAVSLDRKMGIENQRVPISSPMMEQTTMKLRAGAGAVLVGVQTVLADEPRLNVRGPWRDRQPQRVILDPKLRTPGDAKLFGERGPVLFFHHADAPLTNRKKLLQHSQAECQELPATVDGRFDPGDILEALQARNLTSLLIEGGRKTLESFHRKNLIDEWVIYINDQVIKSAAADLPISFSFVPPLHLIAQQATMRAHDVELVASNCP